MTNDFDPYYKWLGIPPKDQPPHHYRLLGIELFETDREVIDAAANRLMGYLKDLAVGDDGAHSQQLLNEIARSRLCLLNKKTKVAYDDDLRNRLKSQGVLESETRKPSAKGPPPKVQKRSVTPPAVPPSAVLPPKAAGPPTAPKFPGAPNPPSAPAVDFEGFKIATDTPPRKPRKATPPNIAVKKEGAAKKELPAKKDVPVETETPAKEVAAKTTVVKPEEEAVVKDLPAQPLPTGRGVKLAWILIAVVGLVGLTLTIVMSVLLLTH